MGILNVTPDSFSDGGKFTSSDRIIAQADEMIAAGADLIDIGGESSRPFALPVSVEEEMSRVIPAIKAIRKKHTIPISVDTVKAEVARQAMAAGADIINDISGMRYDPEMASVIRETDCPVIIMHMQGRPEDMQINPSYQDILTDIHLFFEERIAWAKDHGISRHRIIIDPGIGFGKSIVHNLMLLKHLMTFQSLGCPILVGHSRKSFIGKILGLEVDERDTPTAALSALCVSLGASILRVHDVAKNVQAIRLAEAVLNS